MINPIILLETDGMFRPSNLRFFKKGLEDSYREWMNEGMNEIMETPQEAQAVFLHCKGLQHFAVGWPHKFAEFSLVSWSVYPWPNFFGRSFNHITKQSLSFLDNREFTRLPSIMFKFTSAKWCNQRKKGIWKANSKGSVQKSSEPNIRKPC